MARGGAIRVGLTGGIGSGKSTVAGMFAAMGATVIDADAISRQATAAGGVAIPEIARQFGAAFVDATGALDRNRMRELVFTDAGARQRLESIVHPVVGAETARQLESATSACIILDIPLLVESGRWRSQLDKVLVVDCEEATQRLRVAQRSGLADSVIAAILANQALRQDRLACADAVLFNQGLTLDALQGQVRELARSFGL